MTYDDHYLDYWGDVFCACHLAGAGVTFQAFLKDPLNQIRVISKANGGRWARLHGVGVTSLVRVLCPRSTEIERKIQEHFRIRGIEEHADHDQQVHRFQGEVVPLKDHRLHRKLAGTMAGELAGIMVGTRAKASGFAEFEPMLEPRGQAWRRNSSRS